MLQFAKTRFNRDAFICSGSSSSEGGGHPDEADNSDSEIVQPPDELEMKHLKKLETMKESPA